MKWAIMSPAWGDRRGPGFSGRASHRPVAAAPGSPVARQPERLEPAFVNNTHFRLVARGLTHTGMKRPHNEDSFKVSEDLNLFSVADGMGGHAAGEVASRTAVDTLHDFVVKARGDQDFTWPFGMDQKYDINENILLTGFHLANRKVCQMAREDPDLSGMGTTMVALYAPGESIHIAHVGDSRVYRYREGALSLLTMDHSWVNEQLQRNIITEEEARNHRWRNVITRALGNRPDLEIDLISEQPREGDLYLLCSDGLTGMLQDSRIEEIIASHPGQMEAGCEQMIEEANAAGGQDNITVLLLRVTASEAALDETDEHNPPTPRLP